MLYLRAELKERIDSKILFTIKEYICLNSVLSSTDITLDQYTEKNLLVNFTIFIKKFIIFLVMLGHTQNLGFLLF